MYALLAWHFFNDRNVVVEDHDALCEVTAEALRGAGHHVISVDCAEALAETGNATHVDIMVINLNLLGEDGTAWLTASAETDYSKASLEVQMVCLRKKLVQAGSDAKPIKAIHRLGYQLLVKVHIA